MDIPDFIRDMVNCVNVLVCDKLSWDGGAFSPHLPFATKLAMGDGINPRVDVLLQQPYCFSLPLFRTPFAHTPPASLNGGLNQLQMATLPIRPELVDFGYDMAKIASGNSSKMPQRHHSFLKYFNFWGNFL